jgi:toxin YoeB
LRLLWSPEAWEDYVAWQADDPAVAAKINALLKDVRRSPFTGLGKPEPLKSRLAGWWSRRVTGEHRLVYRVTGTGEEQRVEIVQCRHHY